MHIKINEDYNVVVNTALLGYVGETNARPVSVEGLTVDGADRYVLTIDYGDGVTYEVDITGGTWTPTADILRSAQTVSCQIAAKKLSGDEYVLVKKSRIFRLRIGAAIDDNAIPSPSVAADALDRISAIGEQVEADVARAENAASTAMQAAETSAAQADTARQGAETARQQAVKSQNSAKVSAAQASASAQQTEADKTITAGYAKTAKTNADSTATDRQAVADMAEQVTADKTTVADHAAKVAADRKAAETAAQTAQAVADSLPEDYTTAVGKIAENTAEISAVKLTDKELKRRVDALYSIGQGVTHRFETDTDTAYAKTVPTGAKLMSVKNIGGRSIVFNQIFQPRKEANNGATVTADSDGTITINGTTTASYINFRDVTPEQNKIGKYAFKLLILNNPDNIEMGFGFLNRGKSTPKITSGSSAVIYNQTQSEISLGKATGISVFSVGTVFNDVKIKIQIFDLTLMFGSGNEPSTVEEFEKMFPDAYYQYNAGEIVSAGVTEVAVGDNAYPIPEAIRNLPGYGWSAGTAKNYVDYENKRYVQCVNSVDLGTLNWTSTLSTIDNSISIFISDDLNMNNRGNSGLCSQYDFVTSSIDTIIVKKDKFFYYNPLNIAFINKSYTDAAAFKQAMSGVMLYYELATPIVTDISTLIPDDFLRNIEVEAGGSVIFKNSNDNYHIPVPSEEEYIVKLSEVGGTT